MSFIGNSLGAMDEPYRRQMTSYRRTRSAILEATKNLIAMHGVQAVTMIEIADTAEVSRATLYNHFRSKESVIRGLLESEVERILELADGAISAVDALTRISIGISSESALVGLRRYDPAMVTQLLSGGEDPLWRRVHSALLSLLHSAQKVELALRWLMGQVFAPLTAQQSAEQARVIAEAPPVKN